MNLEEAIKRSDGDKNYPDIINIDAGLFSVDTLNVIGIPTWNRKSTAKRKMVLEIRTFRGISSGAIHFYGTLVVDGIYTATFGNIEIPLNLSEKDLDEYPLLDYKYKFKILRPITQLEIDAKPDRLYMYKEGDLIMGFENINELINDTIEIIKLRFTGDWSCYVQYPRGDKEVLIIN